MPPKKKIKKEQAEIAKKEEEEVEESSEDEEEDEEETDDEDRGRGKRKRMSSATNAFEPDDFTMQDKPGVIVIMGRGKALQTFPTVVANLEKHSTEDVLFAHRFLFGNRGGKLSKKGLIANLLQFSGYLKAAPYREDKLEAEDELEETKYSKKAFKMTLGQLKMLCDIFNVDRSSDTGKALNKDDTVENLLDFLSQPNADFLKKETSNGPPKKKPTPKKKAPAKAKMKAPEDPFAIVKAHNKGKIPNEEALRQWVKAYVVCFDMDSATTKHAIRTASDKFGVDLTSSKQRIKELLAEEM